MSDHEGFLDSWISKGIDNLKYQYENKDRLQNALTWGIIKALRDHGKITQADFLYITECDRFS
jgi:hypothetical protein